MGKTFKGILLLCVILLQTTIFAHFTPFNVLPNYTIVVLMAIVIVSPEVENVIVAGITGALLDTLTGVTFGVNTLLCIYLAIACIMVSVVIYNRRFTVFAPIAFLLSFIYELLFGVASCLLRSAPFYPIAILEVVLPVAIVNTLFFILVYEILRRLRFEKKRKGIKYEQ